MRSRTWSGYEMSRTDVRRGDAPAQRLRRGLMMALAIGLSSGCEHSDPPEPVDLRVEFFPDLLPAGMDAAPDLKAPDMVSVSLIKPIFESVGAGMTSTVCKQMGAADFNGDGTEDLLVAGTRLLAHLSSQGLPFAGADVLANPGLCSIGDVTGDGKTDIVMYSSAQQAISTLPGTGDGRFGAAMTQMLSFAPWSVALADFDEDKKLDALATHFVDQGPGFTSALIGTGAGMWKPGQNVRTNNEPTGVAVFDADGDNHLDAVVIDSVSDLWALVIGNGDGTFMQANQQVLAGGPNSLVVIDFNHDGLSDFAVALGNSHQVAVFMNRGAGDFAPPALYDGGKSPHALMKGDFNSDGRIDLAVLNYTVGGSQQIAVILATADGKLAEPVGLPLPKSGLEVACAAVADFDRDGKPDFAMADFRGSLTVLRNKTP